MTTPRKPQIDLDLDYVQKLKAIGMSDKSIPDVTFTFADYQCLERLMNVRDITIEDELKEFLQGIYEKDNEAMCKNVADIVSKQLGEVIAQWSTRLDGIEKSLSNLESGQSRIAGDISSINIKLRTLETNQRADEMKLFEHELRLNKKKEQIEELQKNVTLLQPEPVQELVKEVHNLRPTILKLTRTQIWYNIGFRISTAVVLSFILFIWYHDSFLAEREIWTFWNILGNIFALGVLVAIIISAYKTIKEVRKENRNNNKAKK